ncbi:unnamed protein product [Caenorhabditis auriculariae]|uniref:Domain of unknown function DB domain-containing protein n=1 Tax=Caenorhabditis auriculariae TaxID=2777116 RepID=A0A8S1GYU0_9PELO|nr:unnamed protein product [Caenorhabditis auriculariae]
MLPDSPSPRAALALSDLQPQTGASTFSVGTGSGNWSTRGVGGVGGDAFEKSGNGGGLFGGNRQNDRFELGGNGGKQTLFGGGSSSSSSYQRMYFAAFLLTFLTTFSSCVNSELQLPDCNEIPKVLCCTQRVLDKCMSGCIDYVTEKCPHKLEKYETIENENENAVEGTIKSRKPESAEDVKTSKLDKMVEKFVDRDEIRRAPQGGDVKQLNAEYPITEVSDNDLTSECGTERSQPPFSPCLSRKTADDVFLSCCRQQVPSNCHSLCTYEHREHVAAETLIAAIQQDGCDLKYLSSLLYCANQNRDNRKCCSHLGMSNSDLGVGDRCLRMCNIAQSGNRVGSLEKEDLVCLSNWNVIMYCGRGGLRTIN